MTRTKWAFTPDEFAWVWGETGLDEYPDPISIIESATTEDEYAELVGPISARYPRFADPDLTGPLRVLADPELRIICTGHSHRSGRRARSVGAVAGGLGVILFQKSGQTVEFGGDIQLVVTRRQSLAKQIAATMPPAEPGAAGDMTGYTPRVRGEEPPSSWGRSRNDELPVEERIRALLRAPRSAEGYLKVMTHLQANRSQPPTYLSWIDIRSDHPAAGRYLVDVNHHDTKLKAATPDATAAALARRAGLTQQ
ncbi:ESX secretion-associated protein EspG [Nocardia cyriacigeorgica]|uniref:ESX secretion-associated protein EspG n=1 Tax=Nocardia cyriacigeorgica TaxID=135487 RepID=UPI00245709CA|nr:ESX secretion-associated protein EspG [Nocardia cyriacigeorgica]